MYIQSNGNQQLSLNATYEHTRDYFTKLCNKNEQYGSSIYEDIPEKFKWSFTEEKFLKFHR
jgi:hypothetical protein